MDVYTKSLNHVKEDLLIDLDLPPLVRHSTPSKKPANATTVSILDEPIDVPEIGQDPDWGHQSIESLPSYSSNTQHLQSYTNLCGAKSLDQLSPRASQQVVTSQPDPFDTSQRWSRDQPNRSDYDIQLDTHYSQESQRCSSNSDACVSRNNVSCNNSPYNTLSNDIYTNTNQISIERNNVPSVATSLANMSLDDRISESLNLRSKNTNNDNLYANTLYNSGQHTSHTTAPSNLPNERYNEDIPVYNNFDINPIQQQFILETKDYYTKLSTPSKVNVGQPDPDYEKNIYVPKYGDEAEKLRSFSDSVENSKNYSALKYQNVDYGYADYGTNYASTSRAGGFYDEVNETASNFYSEIGNTGDRDLYASTQGVYSNAALYDEVYDDTPRPHRPAPPCPNHPK